MNLSQPSLFGGVANLPKARDDGNRILGDAYYTPDALALAIVEALQAEGCPLDGEILEPSVGGGAFLRALLACSPRLRLTALDINPEAQGLRAAQEEGLEALPGVDFLSYQPGRRYDLILGNPPYAQAEAHVRHALHCADRVVFLLRSAFGESAARVSFWRAHPARHVWMCAQRPSFTSDGRTDGCAYSVFYWDQTRHSRTTYTPCWDWRGTA